MYLKAEILKSFVEIHILNPKPGLNLNPNILNLNSKAMYKIANHFWNYLKAEILKMLCGDSYPKP
jgi:hypothetical protein